MSAIRACALAKTFRVGFFMRPVHAVRGVDLDVPSGGIFGFLGPNGSGKTTTIKMLTGLIQPTSGEAFIGERPVADPAARRGLGFLPEGTYFHEYLTGAEFLDFHGQLLGLPKAERRAQAERLLARVGLAQAGHVRIRRYSKGMRQRVGLAQALMGDPGLLILDEPMSGLDPLGRKDVRDLILSLRDEGRTVFLTSHILADAEMVCDAVAIILAGRIVEQGSLDALLGQELEGIDLVVEGIDPELEAELARAAAQVLDQGTRHLFRFQSETEAEQALDRVREAKGRVRSLTRRRKSLEDLLVEGVSREASA